jgi:hypothetical protein
MVTVVTTKALLLPSYFFGRYAVLLASSTIRAKTVFNLVKLLETFITTVSTCLS